MQKTKETAQMENPATAAFAGRLPEMRGEFGDWQTGYDFACEIGRASCRERVCQYV